MGTTKFRTGVIVGALYDEAKKIFGEDASEGTLLRYVSDTIYDAELVGVNEYKTQHRLVFEFQGKHWAFVFNVSDGIGYNDILGTRPLSKPWYPETKHFECYPVQQVTKAITVWEKIDD